MEIDFWGARGSYPIASRDNIYFGGNTSCIYIKPDEKNHIIIDGGTGIRELGNYLCTKEFGEGKGQANLLLSHAHWDHVLGLPFFGPFYISGNRFNVYGAVMDYTNLQSIFKGLHDTVYFPISLEDLPGRLEFIGLEPGKAFEIDDIRIKTMQLNHHSVNLGYRIEKAGRVCTFLFDIAPIYKTILGDGMLKQSMKNEHFREEYTENLLKMAQDADIMVYDAHFSLVDIEGKEHFGHSTPEDALDIAIKANVKTLILFHHSPEDSDEDIWLKERQTREKARAICGQSMDVIAAYEGLHLHLFNEDSL